MAKALPKITLSPSRDIPLDKLILSQSNVRRVKNGVTIGHLADSIARRGLLHGLNVRPQLDADGNETGLFEVPAGGRRYSALGLLVKRKQLAKNALVPCVVKAADDTVLAEEDSLAENSEREPLHPLDEFRGMKVLSDKGEKEEAIAAHFRVTPAVVKQRLKLASVSPKLHEIYAAGDMTLDHLMAFSVSEDHARQEQVWELLEHSSNDSPQFIKDKLNEDMVPVTDRRVRFIGVEAYFAAGGAAPARDLFEPDDGGWLTDPALIDHLVVEKLEAEAAKVQETGWKWVEAVVDLPYGAADGMRRLGTIAVDTSPEEDERIAVLEAELEQIEAEWDGEPDVPQDVCDRAEAIQTEIADILNTLVVYEPGEVGIAGAFVTIQKDGSLFVDCGWVRPEDEPEEDVDESEGDEAGGEADVPASDPVVDGSQAPMSAPDGGTPSAASTTVNDEDEEDVIKPLPDRLVAELTAARTVALQDAFAQNPSVAFAAVLHSMVLTIFYQVRTESCLALSLSKVSFPFQAPGLRESAAAQAMAERKAAWEDRLPKSDKDVWDALQMLDGSEQAALFALCAAYGVDAQWEPVPKHGAGRVSAHGVARRVEHANVLARAVGFDMVASGWRPTVENYLGRVAKPRILEAVAEGTDPQKAGLIEHLKKSDMACEAERLLAESDWLPEPLRMPVVDEPLALDAAPDVLPAFLEGDGDASDDADLAIAAE